MWISTKATQSKRIVALLSRRGALSAKQLHRACSSPSRQVSIQGVYKDLRRLESAGVVVRSSGEYSLSFTWLLELTEFARDASSIYLGRAGKEILLGDVPKRSWKFSDFRLLDSFWMEVILAACSMTEAKEIYGWIPHPWFDLFQPSKVSRFRTQLIATGTRISHIVGGDRTLDRNVCRAWPAELYRYAHAAGPFEGKDASYIQLIGDFLLTVTLDDGAVALIEELFRTSPSTASIDLYSLNRLLSHPLRARMSLEKNPDKIRRFRRKFVNYFA